MQVTVELKDMFSYSIIPVIVALVVVIILIILLILSRRRKNKPKNIVQVIIPPEKDIEGIKNKYLEKIDVLVNDFDNKNLNKRGTYQELSVILRSFIYEMTNIQVQYFTLKEIEKINMPQLYELVKEYYDPEFSKMTKANLIDSIEKTKKVIEEWN